MKTDAFSGELIIKNNHCDLCGQLNGLAFYLSDCMAYLYIIDGLGNIKVVIEADCGQNFGFIDDVRFPNNDKL